MESKPSAARLFAIPILIVLLSQGLMLWADPHSGLQAGHARLQALPAAFDGWTSKDAALDANTLNILQPDNYLWRTYRSPEGYPVNLLAVYGHLKQTFHSPGSCLPGGGWTVEERRTMPVTFDVDGVPQEVHANILRMDHNGHDRELVVYWFAQGAETTSSITLHGLMILRKRALHQNATGALIRLVTPDPGDEDAALSVIQRLLSGIYPELIHQLTR